MDAGSEPGAPSSAWAVGHNGDGKTQIARWDGTVWTRVPNPKPYPAGDLNGVTATSASSVWAVGEANGAQTLILYWNGTGWVRVPSPSPGITSVHVSVLLGAAATSPHDVWAVGYECVRPAAGLRDCPSQGEQNAALILHWNGTAWTQVPSP
jgi:hypothetical protein